MGSHPSSDIGEPGTSRYRRMWELQGISQRKFGEMCKPRMPQAHVSQFEVGRLRMTWALAKRIAPAQEPQLWACGRGEQQVALIRVWRTWFRNVEVHGEPDMKQFAAVMRKRIGAEIFMHDKTLWDLVNKREGAGAEPLPTAGDVAGPAKGLA